MFRPGKNPKDQTHTDDTADHTPQQQQPASSYNSSSSGSAGYGSSPASGSGGGGSGSSSTAEGYSQPPSNTPTGRAVTESESLARDIKEGTLTGFVGNGTSLTGEASFKGMLRVDGHLSGRVSSQDGTLIVSTNGKVDANLEVAVAQIYGTVTGDIIASKRIEMGRVSRVTGNIQTPALIIENGALFEGSCRMVQLKEAADNKQPSSTTSNKPQARSTTEGTASAATSSISSSPYSSSSLTGASASKDATKSSSDKPEVKSATTDAAS